MLEYRLAHIGINNDNEEEALKGAKMMEALFGFKAKVGNSSIFTDSYAEFNKFQGRGKHGHIAIATPDIKAAVEDLESRGFTFIPESAVIKDGKLKAIYLTDEICGFAIHLVQP